jgi:hypothetical protein
MRPIHLVKDLPMRITARSWVAAAAVLAPLLLGASPALGQTATFARGSDGGPPACSLIKGADVLKLTRNTYTFPEEQYPAAGGTLCSLPGAELLVLSGPDSAKRLEKLLESKRRQDEPRKTIGGLGDKSFAMYPKARNSTEAQVPQGLLVTQRGAHTLSLAVDVEKGKPLESIEPTLVSLMKTVLARLP